MNKPIQSGNRSIIILVVTAVLVTIVAGIVLFAVSGLLNSSQTIQKCQEDFAKYQTIASELKGNSISFQTKTFGDSSSALKAFAEEFNKKADSDLQITYTDGASYATGSLDPWGNPYYITAKKDNESAEKTSFSIYIVSGGENQHFDYAGLTLDGDDLSLCLLQGTNAGKIPNPDVIINESSDTPSDFDEDFGISEILENKPPVEDNSDEMPEDTYSLPAYVTITFNQQGSGEATTLRVKNGNMLKTYNVAIPVRENYTFEGYYSDANSSGIRYFTSNGIGVGVAAFESDVTMFAGWSGNKVSLMLDNTGGSGKESITATYGSTLPSVTVPSRPGFTFVGYFAEENGQGTQYYNSKGVGLVTSEFTESAVLYAYWSATTFTVEHYVMGVDGKYPASPTSSEKVGNVYNQTVRLDKLADPSLIVSNGIVFDYGTVNGSAADSVTVQSNDTVVKIYYRRCEYTVTLNEEEGVSEITGAGSYYYGQKVTVDAELEDGYRWTAWINDDNGNKQTIQKYSFLMPNHHVVLLATAQTDVYTITLNANGGYCATKSIAVQYGEHYAGLLPTATRMGYTFAGWGTTSDAKTAITESEVYSKTFDTTLYAIWAKGEIAVIFDQQGGEGGTKSASVTLGSALPQIIIPRKSGYDFAGYFEKTNGGGMQYYDESGTAIAPMDFQTGITMYALWVPKEFPISYRDQYNEAFSGTYGANTPHSFKMGETVYLIDAERTGYTFDGWYTDPECTKKVTKITPTTGETLNLYAKWVPISVKIKFDPGSGVFTTEQILDLSIYKVTYNQKFPDKIPESALPTKEGHNFAGFYLPAEDGSGNFGILVYNYRGELTAEAPVSKYTEEVTLYARFAVASIEDENPPEVSE